MKYVLCLYVKMLRCVDNSIYTGITTDIERRLEEHLKKYEKCAKYTRVHIVKKVESVWETANRILASKLEYRIKKLNKQQKESLILNPGLLASLIEKIDATQYILKNAIKKGDKEYAERNCNA